jgi:CDGSH-type Zn-finger protein
MPGATGPVLVQGPVEVVLDDGSTLLSERPVVALCACGRSGCYPFCDTSHRRRSRPHRHSGSSAGADAGADAGVSVRSVGERDDQ